MLFYEEVSSFLLVLYTLFITVSTVIIQELEHQNESCEIWNYVLMCLKCDFIFIFLNTRIMGFLFTPGDNNPTMIIIIIIFSFHFF